MLFKLKSSFDFIHRLDENEQFNFKISKQMLKHGLPQNSSDSKIDIIIR